MQTTRILRRLGVMVLLGSPACNTILGIDEASLIGGNTLPDGGTADPNSCQAYCATMQSNCRGANQAYTSAVTCQAICATFETGVQGETSNDSLACRITRAKQTVTDPTTSCPKAGALATGCTDPCTAFCAQAFALCKPTNAFQYESLGACKAACVTWPYIMQADAGLVGDLAFSTGDSLNCRLYHLQSGYDPNTPKAAEYHCPHAAGNSTKCF
jgi:hypothetical protein